ncbi:pyridoxamine 5'-phosphate oxidase [Sphingomonas sp. UNC305MFCol5.2]|uniref:pyridoxamine 5'-phosphate oxidase n=1 Tax=Sphingomonas sp. UNC305MFCol5.2 TaxID=1449076 RepID=UPI0004A72C73|nr:pyridoxamine 5'-phosphate oxidase [Sphingomonas sp. UNC305MFCol5.2]
MIADPFELFAACYAEAAAAEPDDANAMALATAGPDGQPSVRMVLLKEYGREGFVFYTNFASRKARELEDGKAALLFHWKSMRRQVRIEGDVRRVSDAESDAYFALRDRDSQIGAWASDQSRPLDSRQTFEARFEAARMRFAGKVVPRPPHWGGYRVDPVAFEFWQDRAHRLHERRIFTRAGRGWCEGLLYP